MSEEFQEANLDTEPAKVAEQEATFLFKELCKKRRSLAMEYVYHWNRLLIATARIPK